MISRFNERRDVTKIRIVSNFHRADVSHLYILLLLFHVLIFLVDASTLYRKL